MRIILLIFFALLSSPALAQDWTRYDNDRFGYSIDVPPDFYMQDSSDSGDGASFALTGRPSYLVVWGGHLMADFEGEVAQRMSWAQDEAWNITDQVTTPGWASFSGIKGSRILYQRMILLCDGASYAAFQAEYSVAETSNMDSVIERLVQSLRGSTC